MGVSINQPIDSVDIHIHVDSVDIHILYFIRSHYIHIIVVTSSSTDVLLLRLPQIISDAGETLSTFSEPRRQRNPHDVGW